MQRTQRHDWQHVGRVEGGVGLVEQPTQNRGVQSLAERKPFQHAQRQLLVRSRQSQQSLQLTAAEAQSVESRGHEEAAIGTQSLRHDVEKIERFVRARLSLHSATEAASGHISLLQSSSLHRRGHPLGDLLRRLVRSDEHPHVVAVLVDAAAEGKDGLQRVRRLTDDSIDFHLLAARQNHILEHSKHRAQRRAVRTVSPANASNPDISFNTCRWSVLNTL